MPMMPRITHSEFAFTFMVRPFWLKDEDKDDNDH